jgi:competence protein ComEC
VSLASQLAVAPILAINFHRISLIALIGNVVVLPVVPPLLGAGVLSAALASLAIAFTRPLMLFIGFILGYLFRVVHLLAELPFSTLEIWSFGTGGALIYYLFLFSVFPLWQKMNLNCRQRRIVGAAVVLLLLILFLAFLLCPETPPQALTVSVLDVGQGDSILIQSREGINILVDGGEDPRTAYEKLRKRGVRHLDLVILSHPHEDHLKGLLKVIEKLPVGAVLDGDSSSNIFPYQEFREIIEQKKIPYRVARKGEVLDLGPDLKLMVLWPDDPPASFDESQVNNLSVVVKLVYHKFTMLLSGDIEEEGQQQLVDGEAPLESVVFKVPHHGSIDALNQEFLEQVKPQIAVISVGAGNEFGHPSKKTLHILESLGVKIFRTDLEGDIVIKTDGQRVEVLSGP